MKRRLLSLALLFVLVPAFGLFEQTPEEVARKNKQERVNLDKEQRKTELQNKKDQNKLNKQKREADLENKKEEQRLKEQERNEKLQEKQKGKTPRQQRLAARRARRTGVTA